MDRRSATMDQVLSQRCMSNFNPMSWALWIREALMRATQDIEVTFNSIQIIPSHHVNIGAALSPEPVTLMHIGNGAR